MQSAEHPIRFILSPEQAETIGRAFYADSLAIMPRLGQNFHQSIARMTVHTLRIAHILTMLRQMDYIADTATDTNPPLPLWGKGCLKEAGKGLLCSEADFTSALLIGRKLLLHAADAYTQINADRVEAIPAARGSYQQLTFLTSLPNEFSTEECLRIAATSGIAERSVARWLSTWTQEGVLTRPAKGFYRKTA